MIKNEKQYNSAKTALRKWLGARKQWRKNLTPSSPEWLRAEEAFAINQEIRQLTAEIKRYDETISGKIKLPDPSIVSELPELLVSWRIARHWTQRELADRVGMHENQIQKYESEDYACASLHTISRIAEALAI